MIKIRAYADLHLFFKREYMSEYITQLTDIITELQTNPVDLLVFAGDTMHKAYNMNEEEMKYIFSFIKSVVEVCEKNHILFRVIKGTASHDCKIVESLSEIYRDSLVFKAIYEPCIEEIKFPSNKTVDGLNNLKVRWLPESYYDKTGYDVLEQDVLSAKTDLTFFHGTIKSQLTRFHTTEDDYKPTMLPKSIIWDDDTLIKNTKFLSAGGHIHKSIGDIARDRVIYINSYTAHDFGDKDYSGTDNINNMKGYIEIEIANNTYKAIRKHNDRSRRFVELKFDLDVYNDESIISNIVEENLKYQMLGCKVTYKYKFKGKKTVNNITRINQIKEETKMYIKQYDQIVSDLQYVVDPNSLLNRVKGLKELSTEMNKSKSILNVIQEAYHVKYGEEIDKETIERLTRTE